MKKDTVEIARYFQHIYNYALMYPPTEKDYLDALISWSLVNPDKYIYKHLVRTKEENISDTEFHSPFGDESKKIPYCDLVYYVDIYYQDKCECK